MYEVTGKIVKATAGFYYVRTRDALLGCRARGVMRKENVSPLVGDDVIAQTGGDGTGSVAKLLPRRNALVRPPLANLDAMVLTLSVTDPAPNLYVVDKFLALLEKQEIPPLIAITKSDLEDAGELAALYGRAGFPVFVLSCRTGEGLREFREALRGKLSAFSGNSGVGKSSLLNALDPALAIEVGDTSRKLGRGRHTTRHTELFELEPGTLIADTPGFSSIVIAEMGGLDKDELALCFREFAPYLGRCRFADCAHTCERGCAVLEAVRRGGIDSRRHSSYVHMYNEVKDVKPWEQKNTRNAPV